MALARREDYYESLVDERYEIIHGRIYMMDSPGTNHQEVLMALVKLIGNFLSGKPCRAFFAPYDIRLLDPGEEVDSPKPPRNSVQPDLVVICDRSKITPKGCVGPPDLVIEVLSPSTPSRDLVLKRNLYERSGVLEYWVIDPVNRIVNVMRYEQPDTTGNESMLKPWVATMLYEEDELTTPILEGLTIQIKEVFADLIPEN